MRSQEFITETIGQGFHVYMARVKVKNPDYNQSIDVAVFAKSPAMAKLLLQGQYGKDSVVSGIMKIS
jgi:hypothetical protein